MSKEERRRRKERNVYAQLNFLSAAAIEG